MVHVFSTMWSMKNQPSNSISCSDNALRLLVLVAGILYWGLQMKSSFSIWGCILKGCFERGIFWRAKLRLKGIEDWIHLKWLALGHVGSLKLYLWCQIDFQKITSTIHTIPWLLCWMNERYAHMWYFPLLYCSKSLHWVKLVLKLLYSFIYTKLVLYDDYVILSIINKGTLVKTHVRGLIHFYWIPLQY